MINDIRQMPKVELHLHLDGAVSVYLAMMLSGLSFKEVLDKMVVSSKCHDLKDYLAKFTFPISLMQTEENLTLIATSLVNRLASQHVVYAEVRFAPMFHTQKGLSYDKIIQAVLKGLRSNTKIKTNLILCLMRGAKPRDNMETLDIAYKYLHKGVCAIDLAGDEANYPLDDYFHFFELAKKRHIPFTIHAGEVKKEEIIKALNLSTKRIGHGVTVMNDLTLLERLKSEKVLLEICPTSNVNTNIVSNYARHPINLLWHQGIKLCVNTDNPTVSNITLIEEYMKLSENFSLNVADFKQMNKLALQYAFLDEREKKELMERYFH